MLSKFRTFDTLKDCMQPVVSPIIFCVDVDDKIVTPPLTLDQALKWKRCPLHPKDNRQA